MASRNLVQGSFVSHTMSITAWLELVASGLITGGIYALVALGLNLQYGLMRILNIAHGEFLMVGAYLTWMVQTSFGLSPLWMVPVSFGVLMALGLAVHGLCFRRLTATSPNLDIFEARGLMVSFGNSSGPVTGVDLGILAAKGSLYVTRQTLMAYTSSRATTEEMANNVFNMMKDGKIDLAARQTYSLADAAQAHRDLEARKTVGGVILVP